MFNHLLPAIVLDVLSNVKLPHIVSIPGIVFTTLAPSHILAFSDLVDALYFDPCGESILTYCAGVGDYYP